MVDLWLIAALGFVGSFGHCAGMCGPLAIAFSLSQADNTAEKTPSLWFHVVLNLGRIISYIAVGALLGGVGSLLVAGGQFAGVGSVLRQGIAIFTGLLLIWLGVRHIQPDFLPPLPFIHPLSQGATHQRFSSAMARLSLHSRWWTPALLGSLWGFIPCGFLYTAQLKAAEASSPFLGAATMAMFGLGTLPTMLGVGVLMERMGSDRRSQLFRMGGWITLTIGILTLLRSDAMIDYTGHSSIALLMLALAARPLSGVWPGLLRYRRAIGVGSFLLALAHTGFMLDHSLNWNLDAISFMLPAHRLGIWVGIIALLLMAPAAVTSFDRAVQALGKRWRSLHLLTVPSLLLATLHTLCLGSNYLGALQWSYGNFLCAGLLVSLTLSVLALRQKAFWFLLFLERYYIPPSRSR
ncbi:MULTISPECIES: sulfite exporter TauE/SafE family protein [unclassified Leptolyngbya]|uniref:urease accessory protein UreH domain-containing protein n=1 Tax=unclassified Leptolyngbya TaxID=2650499 RepID=UPI001689EF75|nr:MULTISPECIES: sulfite exporter TauE/SafE family protein [unclassified Leptolyngbya]MBD1909676.1 sulfite exporter TauE/SafE family protein [Leptolyngbya sp. FACHB-8]MBD2157547.1 sulfite exporter TauE/SafE family protein [Leptolyngbya sp. FACHB-16]